MGIVYTILNPVFSPILALDTVFAVIVLAFIINLISSGLTKAFVDTHKMKSLQVEMKEHRQTILAAAKNGAVIGFDVSADDSYLPTDTKNMLNQCLDRLGVNVLNPGKANFLELVF